MKSEAAAVSKIEASRNKKLTEFCTKCKNCGAEIWHQNADHVFETQQKTVIAVPKNATAISAFQNARVQKKYFARAAVHGAASARSEANSHQFKNARVAHSGLSLRFTHVLWQRSLRKSVRGKPRRVIATIAAACVKWARPSLNFAARFICTSIC